MGRAVNPEGGEFGTAAYDATIHPANAEYQSVISGRVRHGRDAHHRGDKTTPAEIYSHVYQGSPSPTVVGLMGLAQQRDMIEAQVQRTNDLPFPGVPLGHTPGVHNSPNTAPNAGPIGPVGHHSHNVESNARTRRRFGR